MHVQGIDISRAAERIARESEALDRKRAALYARAKTEFEAAVGVAKEFPDVRRVITWGSILRPDRFTELSDIDICIEGVSDPEEWSRLERALLDVVTFPLDLVRWEELIAPHREAVLARGEVVYESEP